MTRHLNWTAARMLFAGVCASLCWVVLALAEEGGKQYDIDIQLQPLSQALQQFSEQTGLQYGYLPTDDEEEQIVVGPIKGRITADEALAKMLPAGFTFEWINPRTISIVSPPLNVPPGGVNEAVVAKDRQQSELDREQRLSMANGGSPSGSARSPYAFDWSMLVEASSIFDGLDLDPDVPTTVLDRQTIEALGASSVTDLLKYVTQQPYTVSERYLGDGTQFADLRGLGFDTTLVLINGHRTIARASSLTVNAFDLNSIPLGAVERIEIVSDSMSALHGADAIGGVLNIVLREDIPAPRLDIDYGAAAGGAVERHATFGAAGGTGNARGSIVLDYFDRGPLLGRARDRWNNQDFRRFGGVDWRSPTASPGNVRSVTGENLPGLPSRFAAIPAAASGMQLTAADFLPGAGLQNLESLSRYQSVLSEGRRTAVLAQGEYRGGPHVTAFGDFLYVDRQNSYQFEPSALLGATVPATNPHNPFGADVLVDVLLTDLGPQTSSRRGHMARAVGGVRGRVNEWTWEASLQESQDEDVTLHENGVDPLRVASALSATDPGEALNPFGGGAANSPALLDSLRATPQSRFRTEMLQATAQLHGPLVTLPTGQVDVIVGAERRSEHVRYDINFGLPVSGSHERSVTAAYGQVRLPVVGAAAKVPGVHELAFVLSGRFDGYSDVGGHFNPEYALLWKPVPHLDIRTALSRSFRPPPLFDLYLQSVGMVAPIADPARNDEFAFPFLRGGGNPDLKPSNADSFTAGLQYAPSGMAGPRIAATYWRIQIDETIGIPRAERLLAAENLFPERIFRAEPTAADLAAGIPGSLQLVDVSRLNYGSIQTSGVDFSASMTLDTGRGSFAPELSATWVHDYTSSDLVLGPGFNRVGVASLLGSIVRWRAVGGITWNRQGVTISTKARYVPAYDDVDPSNHLTGRSVQAQTLIDAQIAVDLSARVGERSMWKGFELRAGMFNVLDEEPPFAEAGWFTGYDATQGDLRQRFSYLKLSKKF